MARRKAPDEGTTIIQEAPTPKRVPTGRPKGDVTYELEMADGTRQRVTFPKSCNVTYGPLAPGSRSYEGGQPALRIYDTTNRQRAVFRNVLSFRDLSFGLEVEVVEEDVEASFTEVAGRLVRATNDRKVTRGFKKVDGLAL